METSTTSIRSILLNRLSNWRSLVPIVHWLPKYDKRFLKGDIVAGITLASYVLPVSMAYATLAGLPVQSGIYCCLASCLFYALFTSAKQIGVGPTSAISLMVGTTVAQLSGGDPGRWVAIAELTALVIAVICVVAFIFKLSSLVSFISESILLGFKAGAALTIMSTQLPKVFGVSSGGTNFFNRMINLSQHLPETNWTVFLFVGLLALLIAGDKFFPGRPVALIVVMISILAVTFTALSSSGIKITGEIPQGLPSVGRPSLRFRDVDGVLELAFACFLMGYIETISAARTFALKNGYEINPRQELLALGAANFATAFSSGYPVSGGLSQSTVNEKAGAKTPLSLIICSITLAVLLLFLTGLLKNLPQVLLAMIVLNAVAGLIKVKELKRVYELSKLEFAVAMIAFVGVLAFGILTGVMLAVIMSIALLLRRTAVPNVAVLGRIGATDRYSDIDRHRDNIITDGVVIFRVEASLLYFNVDHVQDRIKKHLSAKEGKIKLVILDMSATPYIDVAGSKMLLQLSRELTQKGITLRIVDALSHVRDLLRKQGMEEITGHISRMTSIQDEINEFTRQSTKSASPSF